MAVTEKKRGSNKGRNWLAVHAHNRTGAGVHGSRPNRSAQRRGWEDEWADELEDEDFEDFEDYNFSL